MSRYAPLAAGLALAGALQAVLSVHPHEALYASPLAGGPERGARIACVGDEWGQDAPGLALFARDLDALGAALEADPASADSAVDRFVRQYHDELRVEGEAGRRAVVKRAAAAIRASGLAYRYYGQGEPSAYGFDFDQLPPGPRQGLVAVHATNLYRENEEFRWLERFDRDATEGEPMPGIFRLFTKGKWVVAHRPIVKIGYGIYLYYIP